MILNILLTILKVLGWTLLGILGLVILILILVLCVPFRYEIRGRYHEGVKAKVGVHWLLKFVHVQAAAIGAQILVKIKLLGFTLKKLHVGNWGEEKPKKEKEKKPKKPVSEPAMVSSGGNVFDPEEASSEPAESAESTAQASAERAEASAEASAESESAAASSAEEEQTAEEALTWDEKLEKFEEKWEELSGKAEGILDELEEEKNQKTILLILKQLKKLGKHLLPTGLRIEGDLGTGDPAKTGQLVAKVYRLYPIFGESIRLNGIYDRKETNVFLELKGRLRLGIIVEIAVRLLLNTNFRRRLFKLLKDKDGEEEQKEEKKAKKAKKDKKESGKAA